jgi:UPF0148 protein
LQEKKEDKPIKRMAEMLLKGATLTDLSCPACGSPLFRIKDGTLWCAQDEKKVVIVKEGEKEPQTSSSSSYDRLEAILTSKIEQIQGKIEKTDNVDDLQKLSTALSELLGNLEKVRKMKKV